MAANRKEVLNELGREVIMRRKVYPALIQEKKLHPEHAQNQMQRLVAAMEVIGAMTDAEFAALRKRYQESKEGEVKQGELW